jgi:hypothetical protein
MQSVVRRLNHISGNWWRYKDPISSGQSHVSADIVSKDEPQGAANAASGPTKSHLRFCEDTKPYHDFISNHAGIFPLAFADVENEPSDGQAAFKDLYCTFFFD